MSSIDDIVNSFDIGFFTSLNGQNSVGFDVSESYDSPSFGEALSVEETTPYTPPPFKDGYLEGYTLDSKKHEIPTKIKLEALYNPYIIYDENMERDKEAEVAAFKEREMEHRKEVINDWIKDMGYGDLKNKAELMKAILAKAEATNPY